MDDDKLSRIANQLLGDLEVAANDEQKLQIIYDTLEQVAAIAIEDHIASRLPLS